MYAVHRAVLFKNISGGLRNEAIAAHEFVESGYSVFCSHLGGNNLLLGEIKISDGSPYVRCWSTIAQEGHEDTQDS